MLTNFQIESYAIHHDITIRTICAEDKLLSHPFLYGAYVINYKNTHWTVLIISRGGKNAVYFDSLGRPPSNIVCQFFNRSKAANKELFYNTQEVQPYNGGNCGWYVLALLKFVKSSRSKYSLLKSFQMFLDYFSATDFKRNETILKGIIKK
jgi:hypothetical protein